jgi:hypothetical protein
MDTEYDHGPRLALYRDLTWRNSHNEIALFPALAKLYYNSSNNNNGRNDRYKNNSGHRFQNNRNSGDSNSEADNDDSYSGNDSEDISEPENSAAQRRKQPRYSSGTSNQNGRSAVFGKSLQLQDYNRRRQSESSDQRKNRTANMDSPQRIKPRKSMLESVTRTTESDQGVNQGSNRRHSYPILTANSRNGRDNIQDIHRNITHFSNNDHNNNGGGPYGAPNLKTYNNTPPVTRQEWEQRVEERKKRFQR